MNTIWQHDFYVYGMGIKITHNAVYAY